MHRALTVTAFAAMPAVCAAQHLTLGRDAARSSSTAAPHVGPVSLDDPSWVFPASDGSVIQPIRWVYDSGPVVIGDRVIAVSRQHSDGTDARLWAIDRADGSALWSRVIPDQVFDSWATPTIDPWNATVLYATGRGGSLGGVVQARRLVDGELAWETELDLDAVNATVVVTADRGPADRAFITDYQGFFAGGSGARLYCINVDAFDASLNPHQPGELVWEAPLLAGASGATPAYDGTRVVVATTGGFGSGADIVAFDAGASDAASAELWRSTVPQGGGFFGGVAISQGFVFAATYGSSGGLDSSRLVKLDAVTGDVVWATPSNRTDAIPIAFGDGRLVLSTGIPGFGSVPSVQVFDDVGLSASLVADSALDTWADDGDGLLEIGEFDFFGGWTNHPHVVDPHPVTGGPVAFVGSIGLPTGGSFFDGYTRLSMIDLNVPFGSNGSVMSVSPDAGSSPAVDGATLYSVGQGGVAAFGGYCPGDVDLSGDADFFDVLEHLRRFDADGFDADTTLDGLRTDADTRRVIFDVEASCD